MRVAGRVLAASATVITVAAAVFCIIGMAMKKWYLDGIGLFCDDCYTPPKALSVISFILLVVSVLTLVALILDIFRGVLRYVPVVILFIASIFLLATFTSDVQRARYSSFNLMVAAHFFSYVALAVMAYWLGQADIPST